MLRRSLCSAAFLVPFPLANGCAEDEEPDCEVDAAAYDQSCVVADDCAIVADGNMCGNCRCPLAVINRSDLNAFDSEVAAVDAAHERSAAECDCDAFVDVECVAGRCRGIRGSQ